jgi:hypothetical protein
MSNLYVSQPGQVARIVGNTLPGSVSTIDTDPNTLGLAKFGVIGKLAQTAIQNKFAGAAAASKIIGQRPGHVPDMVIITDISYVQPTNTQFMHSMNRAVYIYNYGDRIGKVRISGLCFSSRCLGNALISVSFVNPVQNAGVENMLSWYRRYKASARIPPMYITIGSGEVVKGFIVGMEVATQSLDYMIYRFNLEIVSLPDDIEATAGDDLGRRVDDIL